MAKLKWKKVLGYQVEVTKYGDVRNLITKKIKNQYTDKDGYKFVKVDTDNGKKTIKGAHQLVALTFCKGYRKGLEINHNNLNKQDNYYKNLIWCTRKQNMQHAVKNGIQLGGKGISKNTGKDHHGENNPNAKLTWKKVKKIRKLYATRKYTLLQLARMFKVSERLISLIINNKIW